MTKYYLYPGVVAYPCRCGFFGIPKTFINGEAVCAKCADAGGLNPLALDKSKRTKKTNRPPKAYKTNQDELILKYLQNGPRRSEEICRGTDKDRTTIMSCLKRLYQEGKLIKSEEGKRGNKIWALPEHEDLLEETRLEKQLATRFLKILRMGNMTTSSLSVSLRIPDFEVDAIGNYLMNKGRVDAITVADERLYSLKK